MSTDHTEQSIDEATGTNPTPSTSSRSSRRAMFLGAPGGAGALFAATRASGAGAGSASSATDPPGTSEASGTATTEAAGTATTEAAEAVPTDSRDLPAANLAASLEVLAVNTYTSALEAATAGDLGEVPPAVAEFVGTALEHHQAALDAWNAVLDGAGEPAVTEPPADLAAAVAEQFGAVTDVAGAAELALSLEQTASDTYLDAISTLYTPAALELAGSIQVTAMQRSSILLFVLGQYRVPDTFANTEMSVVPA